jgi:DNA-directed RNA polymerase subunit RPC12/RpoP
MLPLNERKHLMAKIGRCTKCDALLKKVTIIDDDGKSTEGWTCPSCSGKPPIIAKSVDKWGLEPLVK